MTSYAVPRIASGSDPGEMDSVAGAPTTSVNQIPANVLIKAGSSLLVPRPVKMELDVAGHVAENGQISLAPEAVLRQTLLKAGKNDSVASIAKRYKLKAATVADWNKLSAAASFKPGQQIVLYLPGKAAGKTTVAKGSGKTAPVRVVKHGKPAPVRKTAQAGTLQVVRP